MVIRKRYYPLIIASCLLTLPAWALLVEPNLLVVTRVEVPLVGVTRPTQVLIVSDLHLRESSMQRTVDRYARALSGLREAGTLVDLIVYAGDTLEIDTESAAITKAISQAAAAYLPGARQIALIGNHEVNGIDVHGLKFHNLHEFRDAVVHENDIPQIERAFQDAQITLLDDSAISYNGIRFVAATWQPRTGVRSGVRALLEERTGPTVLLTHSPDQLAGLPKNSVDFALAGHTHGGQVKIPFFPPFITATELDLPKGSGAMRIDGVDAYVSRGVGQTLPIRFGAIPELVLVRFVGR